MINLMPPQARQDIKAARLNVVLVRYCFMLIALMILVGIVYAIGFWILRSEKIAAADLLQRQNEQAQLYQTTQSKAKEFRANLKTAKAIIDKGTPYSLFLTTLANDIPKGSIITEITFGGTATGVSVASNTTNIHARVDSYDKVIELKNDLERSKLFENVSIQSVNRPNAFDGLVGVAKRYPYEINFTATISKISFESGVPE